MTAAGLNSVLAPLAGQAVLHWHGDQFAIAASADLLAYSAACPHQAFSVGDYALGLQFHLETDWRELERWLIGHAGELASAGVRPDELRQAARQAGPALYVLARQVLGNWLANLPTVAA